MKNSTFETARRVSHCDIAAGGRAGPDNGAHESKITLSPTLLSLFLAFGLAFSSAVLAQDVGTELDRMPADLETRFALSALPKALRDDATVHLLDPEKGYELSREGTSGITCIVQRTAWELADYRNDIFIPLCYDAAGTGTFLKVIMEVARLRAEGLGPEELYAEIESGFQDRRYQVPKKAGMSYMIAPLHRTVAPPDMEVHTVSMPHYMPYAPFVTNEDIGAAPSLEDPSSLYHPFIDRQGIDEQSYLIHLVGQKERDQILADEQELLMDLCAYRDVLCDPQTID
ncbi:hypothetical protein [Paracoccus alkanivorans]|nr:hypothetical protein [Paracoccus alkanivorans]